MALENACPTAPCGAWASALICRPKVCARPPRLLSLRARIRMRLCVRAYIFVCVSFQKHSGCCYPCDVKYLHVAFSTAVDEMHRITACMQSAPTMDMGQASAHTRASPRTHAYWLRVCPCAGYTLAEHAYSGGLYVGGSYSLANGNIMMAAQVCMSKCVCMLSCAAIYGCG
jgi:hypothetical protein